MRYVVAFVVRMFNAIDWPLMVILMILAARR